MVWNPPRTRTYRIPGDARRATPTGGGRENEPAPAVDCAEVWESGSGTREARKGKKGGKSPKK
eukprot:scaffold236010_cov26-Tisochrysis_lutea.AAC.2